MPKITYSARIIASREDEKRLFAILEAQKLAVNSASIVQFSLPKCSIVDLHAAFYTNFRTCQAKIPSQILIIAQKEVLSNYRSIKSNQRKITKPVVKKSLSMRLDKRVYSYKNNVFSLISMGKRVKCKIQKYQKLEALLSRYHFCDPLLFVRGTELWMTLTFDIPSTIAPITSAIGIDLGKRMAAVTSEGNFYRDRKFNAEMRQLRFLKRQLQSAGTKSARRHLKILRRKETNKNRNQSHILTNALLNTKADVVVVENLKGLKRKRFKAQNKNSISQVPLFLLRTILTYKAALMGKTVIEVNPRYTSQLDHRTGKIDGIRRGRRYYGADGVVLDSDQNAAINIVLRSQHPASYVTILDGQATIKSPHACKSLSRN